MAILRGAFSEGSLLRRTLVHIGTFAFGSLAFVALLSFILVSLAKSLLPSHAPKGATESSQKADAAEDGDGSKASPTKSPRSRRTRGGMSGIVEEESPTQGAGK